MAEFELTEVPCFETQIGVTRIFPIDVFAMLRQLAEEGRLHLVAREGNNRRQFGYGDIQFSDDTIYLTVPEASEALIQGVPIGSAKTPAAPSASASSSAPGHASPSPGEA